MKKVLVATEKPFAKNAVDGIRKIVEEAGMQLALLEKYSSKDDLLKAVADVDAIIIRSDIVDKDVLEAAKNLKIVVRAGAGFDNIDLDAATNKNVVAMNTPGQNANAVAELVFGMLIYLIRNNYDGSTGSELRGKNIGIHGFGHIGKLVGRIAKGFGMTVSTFDPFCDKQAILNENVNCVNTINEFYAKNHIVSLHLPANDQTKKMINYDLMKSMPNGAVIVNTARKEIIDEAAMVKLFEERKDIRYCSDVAPSNAAEMLQKFPGRVYFTSKKTGAQTHEANNNAGLAAANQIVNFFLKGDKTFQVNK